MNYPLMSDEELLEAARDKDDLAFAELMHRYVKPLLYFAKQYVGETAAAEDIAQETFFKAWKNIKKFKTGKTFRPWLYTIARNTALDSIKKKRAINFSELDDTEIDVSFAESVQDEGPIPSEIFERAEATGRLAAVLDKLHPDHRTMIMMHYSEQLTFDEIATVMNKPMNTVKSWHRRAILKLEELLRTKNRA